MQHIGIIELAVLDHFEAGQLQRCEAIAPINQLLGAVLSNVDDDRIAQALGLSDVLGQTFNSASDMMSNSSAAG